MGVDIHMYLIKDKKKLEKVDFGRRSDWFDNLQQHWDNEYRELPIYHQIVNDAPDDLIEKSKDDFNYGHSSIKVSDFFEWYEKYNPQLIAGWVSIYDMWKRDRKGYQLDEDDLQPMLYEGDIPANFTFLEMVNEYEGSYQLYNFLKEKGIEEDAYIIFWFDH